MLHGHAQHRQLVQLARHGVTGGHQRRQLVDEAVHLVPPALLDLAVGLSAAAERARETSEQGWREKKKWHRGAIK